MSILTGLANTVFPPQCLSCGEETEENQALCGGCWPQAHFISGLICDACGAPLPGESQDEIQYCESCHRAPPSWQRGRAVALYEGPIRRLTLAFKHGDRLEIMLPVGKWMAQAAIDLIENETLVTAVPLYWSRILRRRYNQAALLGETIAKTRHLEFVPDILKRVRPTAVQRGMTREERFENQLGAIQISARMASRISGRSVLIADDVMTTGATLSACAESCLSNGARSVNVVVLARVAHLE